MVVRFIYDFFFIYIYYIPYNECINKAYNRTTIKFKYEKNNYCNMTVKMNVSELGQFLASLKVKELKDLCYWGNPSNTTASMYYGYSKHTRKADLVAFLMAGFTRYGVEFEVEDGYPKYRPNEHFYLITTTKYKKRCM